MIAAPSAPTRSGDDPRQQTLADLALVRRGQCPVHRTLTPEIRAESRVSERKKKGSEVRPHFA
jgi:hypothetical protein